MKYIGMEQRTHYVRCITGNIKVPAGNHQVDQGCGLNLIPAITLLNLIQAMFKSISTVTCSPNRRIPSHTLHNCCIPAFYYSNSLKLSISPLKLQFDSYQSILIALCGSLCHFRTSRVMARFSNTLRN